MLPSTAPENWMSRKNMREPGLDYEFLRTHPHTQKRIRDLMVVVAFDPGETTGWSVMDTRLDLLRSPDASISDIVTGWHHGQIDCGAKYGDAGTSSTATRADLGISDSGEAAGANLMEQLVEAQCSRTPAVAIVLEDFILRTQNKKRAALSPVRVIHRFDQMMWERHIETFRSQPSEKSSVTDDRLKRWGFYAADGQEHARDADRHALIMLRKMRAKVALLRKAYPALGEL